MAAAAQILKLDHPANDHIGPGDTIRTGENLYPQYRVIAIAADRAWVRDIQYGTDHIIAIETSRRV